MAAFTKKEIADELKRRADIERERDRARTLRQTLPADTVCIHCGQPLSSFESPAGEFSLCANCLGDD